MAGETPGRSPVALAPLVPGKHKSSSRVPRSHILAARAGVRSIHCTWGFGQRDGRAATAVAATPRDILTIVDG